MLRAAVVPLLLVPACFSPSGAGGTTSDPTMTMSTTALTTMNPITSATTTDATSPTTTRPELTTTTTTSPESTTNVDPATATASSSTTSPGPDPLCGNGMMESDEECDDGNEILTDACALCQSAACGDGFVWDEFEECDGSPGCDAECRREFLWVFVTNDVFPSSLGGLDAADQICQMQAENANRPGQYKAWLSTDLQSVGSRFVHSTRPWRRTDMEPVADNWDDLIDGLLDNPIAFNEFAEALVPPGMCGSCLVWTNSDIMGGAQMGDCGMWNGVPLAAVGGDCGVMTEGWTFGCGLNCAGSARLYCFEQPLEP
ncbi:DUF4215 domain-containing protein [Nannocystis radixulma]|uniref:DUF4215 domain-containing protein n=1 Tax=Nannocystis radixulma TaxID=2995305 RepID=A0ABT5AZS1_9BACT|nr:DUF4215 domain-containing protein [Nannocystis radixulma]MDC0666940.1 DUF4215 domain-containing protein [Nannocystis radixulma]